MSNKVTSADNQQERPRPINLCVGESSETIRRTPNSQEEIKAYLLGALHDGTFQDFIKRINSWHPIKIQILEKRVKI